MWVNINESFASDIYQLYALVLQVIDGRSIFYYNPSKLECSWQSFQQHNLTTQPQWVWRSQMPYALLKEQQSSEVFVLACLPDLFNLNELAGLTASLSHLRDAPVLIELTNSSLLPRSSRDSLATQILSYCLQSYMLNVALYFQEWTKPVILYNFLAFPNFALIKNRFTGSSLGRQGGQLFPNQLNNLHGYTLRVMPDFSEPNTILYRDAHGVTRIAGFMWNFIDTFAKKLGASLSVVQPTWRPGRILGEANMLEFTKNGSVDIGLITVQAVEKSRHRYYQYSYPIVYGSWCIMLPLERPIKVRALYERILKAKALALLLISFGCYYLSFLLEIVTIPTWIRYCCRCLHLTPRLLALLLICACQAQLFSLMIMCPEEAPIDSFDALLASNLRIFGLRSEFDSLDGDFRARYAAAFRLTNNVSELFQLRNSFNTSWAYTITTIKWAIMDVQQNYFQSPLFRYSDLCLAHNTPYSILLSDESIYHKTLKLFTMRTQESGLLLHWMKQSFIDMLRADRMQLKDYSKPNQVQQLRLQDFQIAWLCYGGGLCLAVIVFAVELLRFYVNVCLDSL
nr:uncharacterized protein LOC6629547 [Drosophila virilis]